MQILGIDHVVLRCRDLGVMLRFYTDVLGCSFTKRNERLGMIHLRAGKSQIDLVDADGALGLAGGAPLARRATMSITSAFVSNHLTWRP